MLKSSQDIADNRTIGSPERSTDGYTDFRTEFAPRSHPPPLARRAALRHLPRSAAQPGLVPQMVGRVSTRSRDRFRRSLPGTALPPPSHRGPDRAGGDRDSADARSRPDRGNALRPDRPSGEPSRTRTARLPAAPFAGDDPAHPGPPP